MIYGILASGSYLLTEIVDQLHKQTKKVNSVERLTRHLNKGTTPQALRSYLFQSRRWVLDQPVIHIDDSDITKPEDMNFESLSLIRDDSKSTASRTVYEKGYHVTEVCVTSPKTTIPSAFLRNSFFKREAVYLDK